jgi:hypothetical protein
MLSDQSTSTIIHPSGSQDKSTGRFFHDHRDRDQIRNDGDFSATREAA